MTVVTSVMIFSDAAPRSSRATMRDCFVASAFARRRASADKSAPRNDEERHTFSISPQVFCASYWFISRPLQTEGAGKAGCALHPRSREQLAQKTRPRAYRSSGGNPTFPAQWFTAYGVLSPAIRPWVVTVIGGVLTADLTPALRRQDHTLSLVRLSAVRPTAPPRPPHPRPASMTLANAPLGGTGFRKYISYLVRLQVNNSVKQKYFYRDA
jgi:hypothetical protein